MESQGPALPVFAGNSLTPFSPAPQYRGGCSRSGLPKVRGNLLEQAFQAMRQRVIAQNTRVQRNAGLLSEYNEFIPNSVMSTNVTVPITAGHSVPSQDTLLPGTNSENFLDPAYDPFVGAPEPIVLRPQFRLAECPEELSTSFMDFPQIMPPIERRADEPVPGTPSPGTASSASAEHKCSSCRKWKPERDFLLEEGRLAATCHRCRASKRQYYKGKRNLGGTLPATQRCTACHEEVPIGDFDATATCSRKCRRCRGEGRPVAPTQKKSSRRPSKRPHMPTEPGKTRCSGCGKAQDDGLFFNYEYDPPRKRNTCSCCRQRKHEADLRKRVRREVEE